MAQGQPGLQELRAVFHNVLYGLLLLYGSLCYSSLLCTFYLTQLTCSLLCPLVFNTTSELLLASFCHSWISYKSCTLFMSSVCILVVYDSSYFIIMHAHLGYCCILRETISYRLCELLF